nr:LysE family transporter [Desulfobacula sp.]
MAPLLNGMMTGMFLQLALGPVFFYILGITLAGSYINSLSGIIAVTLVDYIYIVLSLVGISRLLQEDKIKKIFGIISSLILILFGLMILYKGLVFINGPGEAGPAFWTPARSFTACFVLTVSSPLTIVFWSSVFSAKALEKNYKKNQLVLFGIGTGLSTFVFLSLSMLILSLLRSNIPGMMVQVLNCVVGIVLVCYGVSRAVRTMKKTGKRIVECKTAVIKKNKTGVDLKGNEC